MPTDALLRIQRLAQRVRWLDRARHGLAVVAAVALVPLLATRLAARLGADWADPPILIFSVTVCVVAWWVLEVVLASITAIWETEYTRLVRDRKLPRAIVVER